MTCDQMSRRRFATLTGSAAAAAIAAGAAGPAGAPAHEGGRIPPVVRRWATAWNHRVGRGRPQLTDLMRQLGIPVPYTPPQP